MDPVTLDLLQGWSDQYASDPVRHVAELALSKTDMANVMYVSRKGNAMRHKFSV